MNCTRIMGLVAFLSLCLPALAQGEVIRYAWSGTIEQRDGALADPLGIGGDGMFPTADGATYALAVYVDSAATGAFAAPEGTKYPVLDVELFIDGQAAVVTTAGELRFIERDDENRNDVLLLDSTVAFGGGSDVLIFAIRLPGNTFDLGLNPPLFGDTASTIAVQSLTTNYVTFSAGATPFDVGVVPLQTVPEPATGALMGIALGGLMLSRRRWLGA